MAAEIVLTQTEASALDECEQRIAKGMKTFVEVGTALIEAESKLSPAAFDMLCRVHAGAPAAAIRPILDMLRGQS